MIYTALSSLGAVTSAPDRRRRDAPSGRLPLGRSRHQPWGEWSVIRPPIGDLHLDPRSRKKGNSELTAPQISGNQPLIPDERLQLTIAWCGLDLRGVRPGAADHLPVDGHVGMCEQPHEPAIDPVRTEGHDNVSHTETMADGLAPSASLHIGMSARETSTDPVAPSGRRSSFAVRPDSRRSGAVHGEARDATIGG